MSKGRVAPRADKPGGPDAGRAESPLPAPMMAPMTPRPRLFAVMALMLALLLAFLLWTFAKTVYPNRDRPHVVETDAPR